MIEETPKAAELPKAYDPSAIEDRWAEYWVRERIFNVASPHTSSATPDHTQAAPKKFTMLLPPPNVTGRLHMGHMLNQTEMDILTRWRRMSGETALWVPGTDHAGIATQMMVERQLASEGTSREALGREAFTARTWAWKQKYGGAITTQMRRLGASVDWSREYFTMDDDLSIAVKEAFVRLYEQGLIYRGAYIVNWDPKIQTAVSDLEVESEDRPGKLYHVHYPLADGSRGIVIATTRPETMLGDAAIAVHPDDERYKHLIGKKVFVPLTLRSLGEDGDRRVEIIADSWVKPEFGTGAVKVTPAHDPNDFAIGKRHNLAQYSIFDERAQIVYPYSPYHGMERFVARERIVGDLESAGLLEKVEEHTHAVPISQRSGIVIEPRLSMQWFIAVNKAPRATTKPGAPPSPVVPSPAKVGSQDAEGPAPDSIAAKAIAAVREGHIRFTPDMYAKTYFEWMNNIHDWCISRQLWWGHRIPAWHCENQHITVARQAPTQCSTCHSTNLTQETDVLDTWFSSGLLPFTVFGWPHSSPDLTFYPTQLLVTGFDILFFWVARMIMLGTHFMLEVPNPDGTHRTLAEAVPFKEVYIHALVRDANREKMSKTKGNVIDPIEIITKYGTDAVRFTLASQASPGTDIAFNEARTEGYRAFANKIWNAARFLFMNVDRARTAGISISLADLSSTNNLSSFRNAGGPASSTGTDSESPLESRWITARLSATAASVDKSFADYRFDEAASAIYQFFWGDFCDWYLEIVKLRLNFDNPADLLQTKASLVTLLSTFEAALRLLSPFMPFITEEIWQAFWPQLALKVPAKSIALTRYPQADDFLVDRSAVAGMERIKGFIQVVRARRKEIGVPEKESVPIFAVYDARSDVGSTKSVINNVYKENLDIIARLARVSSVERKELDFLHATPELGWSQALGPFIAVLYERQIDIPAERDRLTKELAKFEKGLQAADRQLTNESFMAKAPAHIVDGLRKQSSDTRLQYDKAKAALKALPTA